jgi:hypothetical protein
MSGNDHVLLSVLNSNLAAVNLYKKCGFEMLDTVTNTSGELVTVYRWSPAEMCYHCKRPLVAQDIIWEQTPVSVQMTAYGIKNIYSQEAVCYRCQNKVES